LAKQFCRLVILEIGKDFLQIVGWNSSNFELLNSSGMTYLHVSHLIGHI
jgi:hypothetical protein